MAEEMVRQPNVNDVANLKKLMDSNVSLPDFIAKSIGTLRRASELSDVLSDWADKISHNNDTTSNTDLSLAYKWMIKLNGILTTGRNIPFGQHLSHFSQFLPSEMFKNNLINTAKLIKFDCFEDISALDQSVHQLLAKMAQVLGFGNETMPISLFDLPYLVNLPTSRTARAASIRERAFFSHCSLLKSGLSMMRYDDRGRYDCFELWDEFITDPVHGISPCHHESETVRNLCCIWSHLLDDKLEAIMVIMKHSKHRAATYESFQVRKFNFRDPKS